MVKRWRKIHPGGRRLISILMVMSLLYVASMVALSQSDDRGMHILDDKLAQQLPKQRLNVYAKLISVDPLKGEAMARIEPWPLDESLGFRYRSGWMPVQDISIHVDAIIGSSPNGDNLYTFKKNVPVGGFDVALDEQSGSSASNVSWYPFDVYTFEIPMSGSYTDINGATQDLPILPLDYTKSIDTFNVTMNHALWTNANEIITSDNPKTLKDAAREYGTGITTSIFKASRSGSTKVLTVIILLAMLTALGSMVPMALLVATKKRPPTLSGLIWGAALTFAMIGLRGLFPGMPPLGILLDKVVYFPSLLITLICSLSILIMWCYREDYVN